MKIIRINQYTSNLALTTSVKVDTQTNSCQVLYRVRPWGDHSVFKHIEKEFIDYNKAYDYYIEVLKQYPNVINEIAAEIWWKGKSFMRNYYEKKYPELNFDNKEDIMKAAEKELTPQK